MPMYEIGMPVSTANPKITHNGVDYNIVESVFTDPDAASTNLSVVSSNAGDNTQNIVIYGIVAGAEVSESIALNGVVPAPLALDFTEVFEAYLDAVCAGIVTISDSIGNPLGTIAIGRRVLSPDIFKRVGKDGNEVILPLNGGCEYVGEVLEGQWKKDWDADIVTYTAMQFRFAEPAAASANLRASSSAAGDTTQTLTVTGLVAGAMDTEAFVLNGAAWVNGAKDFTEVWKMELDAVCVGTVTLQDSIPATIYVLPIGDLLRERFTSLMMGGETNAAGDLDYGWLNNHHPFVMMNDAELTVELEIPTPVTGAPTHDIFFEFYIRDQKELTTPTNDPNFILVRFFVDENGLILQLYKEEGGVNTLLWDGSTADGNTIENVAGNQFWIFRFLFQDGVAGAAAPEDVRHMHVYAKHSASRDSVEAAAEEELFDTVGATQSPYDIDDLLYTVGYPAYQIISANATWYGTTVGSQLEAISTYMRTSYPPLFALPYDFVDEEYGYGDVELWDTKGSAVEADWQQVFDEDHDFGTNTIYLQNGLTRIRIIDEIAGGLKAYHYISGAWVQTGNYVQCYHDATPAWLSYPQLLNIVSISPEKVVLRIRFNRLPAVVPYIDFDITLLRGTYYFMTDNFEPFPSSNFRTQMPIVGNTRFAYVGDDEIADDELPTSTAANTTLADNFLFNLSQFLTHLPFCFASEIPGTAFWGSAGVVYPYAYSPAQALSHKQYMGITPFPLAAGLFLEAEDAALVGGAARYFGEPAGASTWVRAQSANPADVGQVLTIIGDVGGVRTTDTITLNGVAWVNGTEDFDRVYILRLSAVTAGNITVQDSAGNPIHIIPAGTTHVDNAVVLAAAADDVRWWFNAGTHLPAGRYILLARMYDTAQSPGDMNLYLWGATSGYRNEENGNTTFTLGAAYLYYGVVVDIPEGIVADLENIRATADKITGAVNTIYVDYYLIIPIGDGRNLPQDLAHSALRTFTKPRRLYVR